MKRTAGLILLLTACASHEREAGARRPNVLLVVADDLGFSDLGCYGGEIATPTLDGLAAGGVRMTRLYNTARCCPSRGSLLTGHYPHRVGLGHMTTDLGRPGYAGRLSADAATIAQVLAPAGYRSFLAGKWHLGTPDPTAHGFEEFYGTIVSAKTFWDPDHFVRLPKGRAPRRYDAGAFYGTDAVTDHAVDFLHDARRTPERPWFLYLAYNAPHFPLHAPKEDVAKYADRYSGGWDALRADRLARMKRLGIVPKDTPLSPRSKHWAWGLEEGRENPAWKSLPEDRRADLARRMAIYAAMVDRMDRQLGRVIDDLRAAGELENTLIVFLSDNGACAEWDPHGFDGKSGPDGRLHRDLDAMGGPGTFHSAGSGWANASNTPWRLYKHFIHEGGIRSPGIVHWPSGLGRPGTIVDAPAHIIDLLPTFLDAARRPSDASLPGRSLLPVLRGEGAVARELFFEHEGHRGVHAGRWKLVALGGRPWELYDMERDAVELDDVAAAHPDVVGRLSAAWDAWARENRVVPMPERYGVDYLPALHR